MKKNAFLTFIFACIPGAGQMYYGYMKRGTSLLVYFCLFIMLGTIISPLVVGVAWCICSAFLTPMTHPLPGSRGPQAGWLPAPAGLAESARRCQTKMTPKMNKIIGWCLLLTGAYVMYNSVIWPIVESIFVQLGIHWSMIYAINDVIPSIVVAVLLIAFGGRCWALANMPTITIPMTCPRTRLNRQSKQI